MRELDLEEHVGLTASDTELLAAKGEPQATAMDPLSQDEIIPMSSLGINNPDVAVVLSVEYDRTRGWRPNYARDLQITQWTLMVCFPPGAVSACDEDRANIARALPPAPSPLPPRIYLYR